MSSNNDSGPLDDGGTIVSAYGAPMPIYYPKGLSSLTDVEMTLFRFMDIEGIVDDAVQKVRPKMHPVMAKALEALREEILRDARRQMLGLALVARNGEPR